MLCDYCRNNLAARTDTQLDIRKHNIGSAPDVQISQCPKCGGTEWATTDIMVPAAKPSRAVFTALWKPLTIIAVVVFIVLLILGVFARAEPVPKPRNAQCPGDFRASGDYCVPLDSRTGPRAVPKPRNAQCPSGWRTSGDYCVEMK